LEPGSIPGPDYLGQGSVQQVWIDPDNVWLAMEGGIGVHGGAFYLFRYDGRHLSVAAHNTNGSPGAGWVQDLNRDGWSEVILDRTDPYIFAYAAGVSLVEVEVQRWFEGQLAEVVPLIMPGMVPAQWRELNNQAIVLSEAGLWIDAAQMIDDAIRAAQEEGVDDEILIWNAAVIRLTQGMLGEATNYSSYPVLQYVFAGQYWGAVGVMRDIGAAGLFRPDTPLIVGTAAEGLEATVGEMIQARANAALEVKSDLAPAYFLRAWATYLLDPADPAIRADVEQAAALFPQDPLFIDSLEVLP
jgi:hypothetical protein